MKSECPYCGFTVEIIHPDAQQELRLITAQEIHHMEADHPEIIAERLAKIGEED